MSDVEEKARGNGWVSKDEWIESGKAEEDWVSAKVFNDRGNMIGQIRGLKGQLDEVRKVVSDLSNHNSALHKSILEGKQKELEAARRTAIEEGDAEAATSLDEPIAELKEAAKQAEAQSSDVERKLVEAGLPRDTLQAAEDFKRDNADWLDKDTRKTALFKATVDELGKNGVYDSAYDVFKEALEETNRILGQGNQPAKKPDPKVDSGSEDDVISTPTRAGSKKYSIKDLSDEDRVAMNRMINMGVMQDAEGSLTKKQMEQKYIDQLAETGAFD